MKKRWIMTLALALTMSAGVSRAEVDRVEADGEDRPYGGAQEYMDKVEAKRAKYGNEDGLQHSTLLASHRLAFTAGLMNWHNNPFGGGASSSGPSFGLDITSTMNDFVGVNVWGSYGIAGASAGATAGGFGAKFDYSLNRTDVGVGLRLQKVMALGSAHQALVPYLNVGPAYTLVNTSTTTTIGSATSSSTSSSNAIGFSVAPGIEFILGGGTVGFKFNYMFAQEVNGNSANVGVMMPTLTAGWAF